MTSRRQWRSLTQLSQFPGGMIALLERSQNIAQQYMDQTQNFDKKWSNNKQWINNSGTTALAWTADEAIGGRGLK